MQGIQFKGQTMTITDELMDRLPPLSQRQTAHLLGIDVRTLKRWTRLGIIKPMDGTNRYHVREIATVMEKRRNGQ